MKTNTARMLSAKAFVQFVASEHYKLGASTVVKNSKDPYQEHVARMGRESAMLEDFLKNVEHNHRTLVCWICLFAGTVGGVLVSTLVRLWTTK